MIKKIKKKLAENKELHSRNQVKDYKKLRF